jgi:hypothetical protein
VEQQYESLQSCRRQPHVLDDYTVDRVIKVYTDQAGDVGIYEEQLSRWKSLKLRPLQRQEVARLWQQILVDGAVESCARFDRRRAE